MNSFEIGMMRFFRTKYSAMDGRTTVSWQQETKEPNPFTLVSTPSGLVMKGKLDGEIESEEDLQKLAELLSLAWTDRRKLRPQITKTLSGH